MTLDQYYNACHQLLKSAVSHMDKHTFHYVTTDIKNEPFMEFLCSIGCCELIKDYPVGDLVYKIKLNGIVLSELTFEEFKKKVNKQFVETKWYCKEENIKWFIDKFLTFKAALVVITSAFMIQISESIKTIAQLLLLGKIQ